MHGAVDTSVHVRALEASYLLHALVRYCDICNDVWLREQLSSNLNMRNTGLTISRCREGFHLVTIFKPSRLRRFSGRT